jgi:hypothetical protein
MIKGSVLICLLHLVFARDPPDGFMYEKWDYLAGINDAARMDEIYYTYNALDEFEKIEYMAELDIAYSLQQFNVVLERPPLEEPQTEEESPELAVAEQSSGLVTMILYIVGSLLGLIGIIVLIACIAKRQMDKESSSLLANELKANTELQA